MFRTVSLTFVNWFPVLVRKNNFENWSFCGIAFHLISFKYCNIIFSCSIVITMFAGPIGEAVLCCNTLIKNFPSTFMRCWNSKIVMCVMMPGLCAFEKTIAAAMYDIMRVWSRLVSMLFSACIKAPCTAATTALLSRIHQDLWLPQPV